MLTWALITLDWTLRIIMVGVVLLRKRPSQALPWLVLVLAFPLFGMCLYLLIGGNRLGARRSREHARAMRVFDGVTKLQQRLDSGAIATNVPDSRRDLAEMARRLSDLPTVGGNHAELIADPYAFLDRLVAEIDSATAYAHCTFYIFDPDKAGELIGDALIRAAKRGVKARLLVDAVGSRPLLKSGYVQTLRAAGVDVRDMLPVNPVRRRLARIDLRNHRKLAVVDGRVCYTGSQNIVSPEHDAPGQAARDAGGSGSGSGSGSGAGAVIGAGSGGRGSRGSIGKAARALLGRRSQHHRWDDLSVRLTGPIVLQGDVVFMEDWYSTTGQILMEARGDCPRVRLPEPSGGVTAQMVPSGPTYAEDVFHRFIVAALHDAEKSIELCTPYFVPDEAVLLALRIAVARGVSVDVVVPERGDSPLPQLAACSFYDDLLAAGVRIHHHQGLMLHTKSLAIDDDLAIIGSGNLDMRSFTLNFELNLVLYSTEFTSALRAQHARYIAQSRLIRCEAWERRPLYRKLLEKAVGLMGPLL